MKIVIEHGTTKRKILGPFNICGSRDDLLLLADAIEVATRDDFTYGWVAVRGPAQPSFTNTESRNVNTRARAPLAFRAVS